MHRIRIRRQVLWVVHHWSWQRNLPGQFPNGRHALRNTLAPATVLAGVRIVCLHRGNALNRVQPAKLGTHLLRRLHDQIWAGGGVEDGALAAARATSAINGQILSVYLALW
jgi:hypothetical protein